MVKIGIMCEDHVLVQDLTTWAPANDQYKPEHCAVLNTHTHHKGQAYDNTQLLQPTGWSRPGLIVQL
jgi:hypothetical protein